MHINAIVLLSGGIDSPVALLLTKKHANVIAVHFHYEPLTDRTSVEKSAKLARACGVDKLYVYPIAPLQADIIKACDNKLFFVITKRFMMRIAEAVAKKHGASFLVTGESLGQVASQTLQNLFVISSAVSLPIVRPLLTHNKEETITLAREYGTFELSKGPEICNVLGPRHPATNAPLWRVEREEMKLDINFLVSRALAAEEIIPCASPASLVSDISNA